MPRTAKTVIVIAAIAVDVIVSAVSAKVAMASKVAAAATTAAAMVANVPVKVKGKTSHKDKARASAVHARKAMPTANRVPISW